MSIKTSLKTVFNLQEEATFCSADAAELRQTVAKQSLQKTLKLKLIKCGQNPWWCYQNEKIQMCEISAALILLEIINANYGIEGVGFSKSRIIFSFSWYISYISYPFITKACTTALRTSLLFTVICCSCHWGNYMLFTDC